MSVAKNIYYRIISLWIISECILGGIIHGIKIPISGLIVGSFSVICICLIAKYSKEKNNIITGAILVSIFKFSLSPHSPFTAYVALYFQAILGEFIFRKANVSSFRIYLFSIVCLLESGVQRIIIMTIVYGKNFWLVIDETFKKIFDHDLFITYSNLLIAVYIIIHIAVSVLIGYFIKSFFNNFNKWKKEFLEIEFNLNNLNSGKQKVNKKKSFINLYSITWGALLLIYIISYLTNLFNSLFTNILFQILIRSVFILLTWILIIFPILQYFFRKWISNKKEKFANQLNLINTLLPLTQQIIKCSWFYTKDLKGYARYKMFLKISLVKCLST